MTISKITLDQGRKILKAALYVGISAVLDYLISLSVGTTFGVLTPVINIGLVTLKQALTKG